MYTRVSTFKMRPDAIAAAKEKLTAMLPTIMAMDGMVTFTNAINNDGSGVVVSVVESEEQSNANQEQVGRVWAEFAEYLTEPPVVVGYPVLVHKSN